jgi:hypothetical protein
MGYEAISVVEAGTDAELVHGGIDIDLEDETANLRAQLQAVRARADKLAIQSSASEVDVDALRHRLEEEKSAALEKVSNLEGLLKVNRAENLALASEIRDAREELSQMPDRVLLEQRAEAAEDQTRKLESTVEMLGRQVVKARDAEMSARTSAQDALAQSTAAIAEKEEALSKVDDRINAATVSASAAADEQVSQYRKQMDIALAEQKASIAAAETSKARALQDADKKVEDITRIMDERLAVAESARRDEVLNVRATFDKQLGEAVKERDLAIADAKKSASSEVAEAQLRLQKAESMLNQIQASSANELESARKSFEKELASAVGSREKALAEAGKAKDVEIKRTETSVRSKYEKLLDELSARASADLDKVNAELKSKQQEFDASRALSEKSAAKAARERDTMQKRIMTLESKLKTGDDRSTMTSATGTESVPEKDSLATNEPVTSPAAVSEQATSTPTETVMTTLQEKLKARSLLRFKR